MLYQAIAHMSAGQTKTFPNLEQHKLLAEIVIPFVSFGSISKNWGKNEKVYQPLELRIYQTPKAWDKKKGPLENEIKSKKNIFTKFEKMARQLIGKEVYRVFFITPIQGEKNGSQDQQRIYREYEDRFEIVKSVNSKFNATTIRIDKEHPLEDLVGRIKEEIKNAQFIVADLTDERPSCYFEAGYAEGLRKNIIYIASKDSVINPKQPNKIHFDIHRNVIHFVNADELSTKLENSIEKNKDKLFFKDV
jgi:hypothetical protein